MIEQQKAKNLGIKTTMPESETLAKKQQKLEAIKAILPEAVNADNGLNVEALKTLFGAENMALNNQGYSLNFAGKGLAKAQADTATKLELRAEHAQSKNFDETQNMIIRGDNIDVLKILRQNYTDKIKMIYIDPPYNTKNDDFIYKDNFKQSEAELIENLGLQDDMIDYLHNIYGTKTHSGWLAFIYPRLKLARDLLTDDGVIFISIDDNEQANLKIICDEIFGGENTDVMIWRKAGIGRDGKMKNTTTFRKDHEYILVCFKSLNHLHKTKEKPQWKNVYSNPDNDHRGEYKAGSLSRKEESSNPNHRYYYTVISPSGKEFTRQFDFSEDEFKQLNQDKRIYWGKREDAVPALKIFQNEERKTNTSSIFFKEQTEFTSMVLEDNLINTTSGSKEFDRLLSAESLGDSMRPKPSELIRKLIQIGTYNDSFVLDFFAGTGTLGQSIFKQNIKDGGNRKFILAQLDEEIDKKQAAYDFCTENNLAPLISSICIERVNRAGEKIKTENAKQTNQEKLPYENLGTGSACDIGYKVFSLTPRPKLEADEHNQITLNTNRQSVNDKLYNMLAASCKILTLPITSIEENILYEIDNAYYLLAECKTDLSQIKDKQIYIDGYADINLENWLNTLGLDKENITIIY